MTKKVFIYNSSPLNSQAFFTLFEELSKNNYAFSLTGANNNDVLIKFFKQKNWSTEVSFFGYENLFFLQLPFLFIFFFAKLARLKFKKAIDQVVCIGWYEKLIITPIARLLKIKTVWIELPSTISGANKLFSFYKLLSRYPLIICLNSLMKINLEKLGINPDNIKIIQPGIKLNQYNYQDNIFNKLAQSDHPQKKFFSIGTITDLNHKQNIELLFQAIKKCLTIVPNIQLIIVGEGKEKKNLAWLAKKMEIENLVWFVGEQDHLRKWLESFDLFVVSSEHPKLKDLFNTLHVMASGLAIISDEDTGLDDLILKEKTGTLLQLNDTEGLAQEIIRLAQDKNLRHEMGKEAQSRVEKYFSLNKMVEQFEKNI